MGLHGHTDLLILKLGHVQLWETLHHNKIFTSKAIDFELYPLTLKLNHVPLFNSTKWVTFFSLLNSKIPLRPWPFDLETWSCVLLFNSEKLYFINVQNLTLVTLKFGNVSLFNTRALLQNTITKCLPVDNRIWPLTPGCAPRYVAGQKLQHCPNWQISFL